MNNAMPSGPPNMRNMAKPRTQSGQVNPRRDVEQSAVFPKLGISTVTGIGGVSRVTPGMKQS